MQHHRTTQLDADQIYQQTAQALNNVGKEIEQAVNSLLTKDLVDMVKGLRQQREYQKGYIASLLQEIKEEVAGKDKDVKAVALLKLTYLQMMGYSMDWASFRIIETISHEKFTHKRIGYLAACQSFSEKTEVMLLITNLLRKDCLSNEQYEAGLAMNALACICRGDLARDLVPDIVALLGSQKPYLRKKAVLVLYKIFLHFPEALRPSFARLKEKLEDADSSVQAAAVSVICELVRKNAKNYITLAPVLFKIMSTSSDNWVLIKIIKLFGILIPLEERLGKKLVEPLLNILNSSGNNAVVYEAIQTCIIGLSTNSTVMGVCLQKLTGLLESPNQNLKYLGLVALSEIMKTIPRGAHEHRDLVLTCIEDEDETIRRRALTILMQMVDKQNLSFIVDKLKHHMNIAEKHYRDELIEKIVQVCSQNKYKNITDFEWYLSLLMELTQIRDSSFGRLISDQLLDVCVRVPLMRPIAVLSLVDLLEDTSLLEEKEEGSMSEALFACAYIIGEYREFAADPSRLVCAFMVPHQVQQLGPRIVSAYLYAVLKLVISEIQKKESTVCTEIVSEHLPKFMTSPFIEVQERACFIHQFLEVWKTVKETDQAEEFLSSITKLYSEILNPVSKEAQTRVPVPQGLDLDKWIAEPMPQPVVITEQEQLMEMVSGHPPLPGVNVPRRGSGLPRRGVPRGRLIPRGRGRGAPRGRGGPPVVGHTDAQSAPIQGGPVPPTRPPRGRPVRGRKPPQRGGAVPKPQPTSEGETQHSTPANATETPANAIETPANATEVSPTTQPDTAPAETNH